MRYFNKTGWIAAMAGGAAAALVATAAQAAQPAPSAASAPSATPVPQSVLLINGDRLVPQPGSTATVVPRPGSGPVISLGRGARALYLPVYALPYLGRGLAPGLFSPAGLSRAERGGRLRVQVSFTGRRPHLPGITITGWTAGTARGDLNPRVFSAALARQFRADHGHASYGTDGMFSGGVSIAPVGAASASRARTDYPMHELTVTGTNEAGRPDTGDEVVVLNAANFHTFGDPVEAANFFYHGAAKYSVPAGTYWAFTLFGGTGKSAGTLRLDVLPQFTVRGSHTQVHIAARAATDELEAVTPRPSALKGFYFSVTRGGRHHTADGAAVIGIGEKLLVDRTTTRVSVGSLKVGVGETLFSPSSATGVPYEYQLIFAGTDGIIPSLRWTVPAASLATTTERYFQEVPGTGQAIAIGADPEVTGGIGLSQPVPMPGEQIVYMSALPGAAYLVGNNQFSTGYGGGQDDAWHTVRPGQRLTEDFDQDPLHPQPMAQLLSGTLGRFFVLIPTTYRTGNKLSLDPTVFSDNTLGHFGYGYTNFPGSGVKVSGSYAVYQNGALIAHGNPANPNYSDGLPAVTLSSKAAVIRFVLSATRRGARFPLSPVSQTAWTWRSAPEPAAALPPNWVCGFTTSRHCAVQPMMTLNYQVHGLGLNEATAAGRQVIGLTVGHIEPGAPVKVTGAKVQVSFDGGHTWQAATVTPAGSGRFTVSFTAPAGADVTLRTSATDAAGGSVTETIQDAYRT